MRPAGHGSLEQQLARRVGRRMVLERAEVEGLVAFAEVGRCQSCLGAPSDESAVGPGPGVVTSEPHYERFHGAALTHLERLMAELPDTPADVLHQSVP